jgi:hypothetical protein
MRHRQDILLARKRPLACPLKMNGNFHLEPPATCLLRPYVEAIQHGCGSTLPPNSQLLRLGYTAYRFTLINCYNQWKNIDQTIG